MATVFDEACAVIGVGIDTARYGHRVTFLRADKQPAAPPLDVRESHAGYEELGQALGRLAQRHPDARIHVRIDAAGQYAANLQCFLRSLPLALEISLGEPARNAAYRKAHFPKRKSDVSDSLANARYAVVERPHATPVTPQEFLALREVVSQLESQVKQTTRLINQLHNLLGRVFPELAPIVVDLRKSWALRLLARYPTPQRLARAKLSSLTAIPYLKPDQAAAIQQAAQRSVGSLQGQIAESLVRESVREIQTSQAIERRLEKLMHQAFAALPDGSHKLLTSIKGIGPATAAAIVAKVVSLDRFATPAQLVSYFGIFPEENTSGYDRHGRPVPPGTMEMSRQGNDLVRHYLWMAAQTATMHNPAIRALYARQRSRGKRGDVALGHCMRKLLHLVFAVWKSGRPFDPQHYSWDRSEHKDRAEHKPGPASAENKTAAGHKEGLPPQRKVVTAAASKLAPPAQTVNARLQSARPRIDYAYLRSQVTMEQVLIHLGWRHCLKGGGAQFRGPCPIHGQTHDRHRSFSVDLAKQVFRCFQADCSAQGNVLDLWAAIHKLPLYDAALHFAQTFALSLTQNREEEPVFCPSQSRSTQGVITPDAS